MPRFARKKDGTHEMVADAFRQAGWSVLDVYRAPQCPDFFAAHNGRTVAVEVKSRGGKLTASQERFKATWGGEYYVVSTLDEAQAILKPVCGEPFGLTGLQCIRERGHSGNHMVQTIEMREAQQILGAK